MRRVATTMPSSIAPTVVTTVSSTVVTRPWPSSLRWAVRASIGTRGCSGAVGGTEGGRGGRPTLTTEPRVPSQTFAHVPPAWIFFSQLLTNALNCASSLLRPMP